MRIVATSDTHRVPTMPIPDGDVFIHAGDLMQDGYPDEWRERVEWLASLPHKVKIYVPGNHDFHMQVYPGPALQNLRSAGVMCIGLPGNAHYRSFFLPNKMTLLGLPFVTGLDRWAFNVDGNDLGAYIEACGHHDIIVSHMPVHGILDTTLRGHHVGSPEYLNHFQFTCRNNPPKLWISGHIHEGYGTAEVSGTKFYNVAMCNREYMQTNPPMVIDV